ncbi:MAG: ASCH domain-containing protein [Chloroflexi bacterium]|nr:ASCH domain-containing protein [Chloroflexota bacterium]
MEMHALSIQQPWTWLIANGHKDIENRNWRTRRRGWILLHAGKRLDPAYEAVRRLCDRWDIAVPPREQLEVGGIVGMARLVDCVQQSESRWFSGPHGLVLQNARPLPFVACPGALQFFPVAAEVLAEIKRLHGEQLAERAGAR